VQNDILLQKRALALIQLLRQRIVDPGLCRRHRRRPEDFSRECRLTFPVMVMLLLRKSLKSLQARLHEVVQQLVPAQAGSSLSAGAFTHARAKLNASTFVELNEQAVLPLAYGEDYGELVRKWRGHRVIGVDSSVVRLPSHPEVAEKFGWMECGGDGGQNERFPQGRLSVLYDVLNELALDVRLEPWKSAEEQMAHAQLDRVGSGDLILTDRGYTSFFWIWHVLAQGAHFVSRCSRSSFAPAQTLFKQDRAGVSVWAELKAPKELKAEVRKRGWPLSVKVRFVTIRLSTGELEVLVTSLLDAQEYPTQVFGELYWSRWGHETFYGRLKGRLDLENCSGRTLEALEQDFAATILLSNLESIVTGPAAAQLAQRTSQREQPVKLNRAVSFHALKTRLIELLASPLPAQEVLAELTQWFQHTPVSVRKGRKVPRNKYSAARSYHYQRYVRKMVF
jgi:hypothetical protein